MPHGAKCHITPIHGGGHLLNPWGPPLESSLRLVLGDEDVSGVLVIDIVTDQTQYSCYTWYSRYMHGHAGVRHMVCGTKCHTEQSATPQTWWGPPLESVGATSRIPHRGVSAWWRHPQCTDYSDPVHENLTIVTSGTLVIWSLSRLDYGTRRPCPDRVRLECGLQYELPVVWDTGRDWLKYQVVLMATII